MKKVLITGGGGYIGLHLAAYLRDSGYQVLQAARDSFGDITMDFSKPYEIGALRIEGIDAMVHAVSPNESLYKTDPYRALSENAAGIRAAMDFCRNNGIRRFIYFSSFHVFGAQAGMLTEDTPVAPQNDYGLAHHVAELTAQLADRAGHLDAWVIRPSNVFGVPADCGRFKRWYLIPFLFCREAVEKQAITLMTPGYQQRNFVGIGDVCRRVRWILEEQPHARLIHAYGNETLSVYAYAQLVQRIAAEELGLQVAIHRPEGENAEYRFEFTSQYEFAGLAPQEQLEPFVREMLRLLAASGQREERKLPC